MLPLARPVLYPLCLLGGSLLVAVAAAAHPDLGGGDGAAQLAVIAHCESWRVIHWAFLFGFALSLTGLMGVVAKHTGTPGEGAARAGVMVGTFAYGAVRARDLDLSIRLGGGQREGAAALARDRGGVERGGRHRLGARLPGKHE